MMKTEAPVIQCTPIRWVILREWNPTYGHVAGGIYVEERLGRTGTMYAIVLRATWELDKEMRWHDQPMPSDRDQSYLLMHRWDSFEDAVSVAQMAAEVVLKGVAAEAAR